jgi:hypothetical protein
MKKFLVLYLTPVSVLEEWMKTDPETMKAEEAKMRAAWDVWMKEHGTMIKETAGAGSNKRVTTAGTTDIKNEVMMFSLVEAETQEEVAKAFESHPHLTIPEASLDIMPANYIPGI